MTCDVIYDSGVTTTTVSGWTSGKKRRHIANISCVNKSSVERKYFSLLRHGKCNAVLALSALATLTARPFLPSLLALHKRAGRRRCYLSEGGGKQSSPPHEEGLFPRPFWAARVMTYVGDQSSPPPPLRTAFTHTRFCIVLCGVCVRGVRRPRNCPSHVRECDRLSPGVSPLCVSHQNTTGVWRKSEPAWRGERRCSRLKNGSSTTRFRWTAQRGCSSPRAAMLQSAVVVEGRGPGDGKGDHLFRPRLAC